MSGRLAGRIAVVTGASSGIGRATAVKLAAAGARVVLAARRGTRLEEVRREILAAGGDAEAAEFDVTNVESCERFVEAFGARHEALDILVNSAGKALGYGPVTEALEADWREMFETNVLGLMRLTRALLPALQRRAVSDLVEVSSIAGCQPYPNGAGYCASKAAVDAFAAALRVELAGTGVRQLVLQPGLVETEFGVVRFHGDAERASAVYRGLAPLTADDVADCVLFAVTRPAHVCIQTMLVTPTAQASSTVVTRRP